MVTEVNRAGVGVRVRVFRQGDAYTVVLEGAGTGLSTPKYAQVETASQVRAAVESLLEGSPYATRIKVQARK